MWHEPPWVIPLRWNLEPVGPRSAAFLLAIHRCRCRVFYLLLLSPGCSGLILTAKDVERLEESRFNFEAATIIFVPFVHSCTNVPICYRVPAPVFFCKTVTIYGRRKWRL